MHIFDFTSIEWRPDFKDVFDYASYLIDQWNAFTEPDDTIIIAGDVGHCCRHTVTTLNKLNGNKILVRGNHDIDWGYELYACGAFVGIYDIIENDNVCIQHIPERYTGNCLFYIHGHHHRYDMPGMYNKLRDYAVDTYRLNCSADLNNHHPCTLQELILNKELVLDKYREIGLL